MDHQSGVRMPWTALLFIVVASIGAGAGAAYLLMKRAESPPARVSAADGSSSSSLGPLGSGLGADARASDTPLPDVVVTLSEDAVARAGIEVATVGTSAVASRLRIPGIVQPNAYRSVAVTSVVAGRVISVTAESGQHVRRGQTLTEIYSPELAEAQTRYLSSRAELDAHEQELRRTEKLVQIGAASRQELEKLHAEHTAATTMVESHRSRLKLLGLTDADIAKLSPTSEVSASVSVRAPLDGVITARGVNVGLNVDLATPLFTVVDLSTVWVVGDLYERDFGAVRVGSHAIVTTPAFPALKVEGRVSYIDPQVRPETRTAQVRVEIPNPRGELRFGMLAEMLVGDARVNTVVTVPRSAVQVVGDRSVVYLTNAKVPGRFVERDVRLGDAVGDDIQAISGVQPGDVVVSKGSFSLRAERERLGLRPPSP
jgi:cobalt-zinc-cadmium efflux system membrane fusion protein